jgi:hypothetical protein
VMWHVVDVECTRSGTPRSKVINSKITVTKRMAFGFREDDNFSSHLASFYPESPEERFF